MQLWARYIFVCSCGLGQLVYTEYDGTPNDGRLWFSGFVQFIGLNAIAASMSASLFANEEMSVRHLLLDPCVMREEDETPRALAWHQH